MLLSYYGFRISYMPKFCLRYFYSTVDLLYLLSLTRKASYIYMLSAIVCSRNHGKLSEQGFFLGGPLLVFFTVDLCISAKMCKHG